MSLPVPLRQHIIAADNLHDRRSYSIHCLKAQHRSIPNFNCSTAMVYSDDPAVTANDLVVSASRYQKGSFERC